MTITCSQCGNMFDGYENYKSCPYCGYSIGIRNSDEANDHFDEKEMEEEENE